MDEKLDVLDVREWGVCMSWGGERVFVCWLRFDVDRSEGAIELGMTSDRSRACPLTLLGATGLMQMLTRRYQDLRIERLVP
jgi:hypothetical protein